MRIKKAQQDPPGPIDLDEIDPYYDWTAQEQAPLFTQEDISNLEREAAEEAAEEEGGVTGYDIDLDDIEEGNDEDDDIELTAEDLDILRAANVELPTSRSIATPSLHWNRHRHGHKPCGVLVLELYPLPHSLVKRLGRGRCPVFDICTYL